MSAIIRKILPAVLIVVVCLLTGPPSTAQVSIATDNSQADPSAMLDVKSSSKGILLPRLTQSQIAGIADPADGLIVYCTNDNKIYVYQGNAGHWTAVVFGSDIIQPSTFCGNPLAISHQAGSVAPVNKVVFYGTVTNIPGEPLKCWITRNLGADQQATAVDDATEASAGWYWQFNRKQGYMHDGTNRTPNTAWDLNIHEFFDWQPVSDPCKIELGNVWRIPTYTEWYNIDNAGNWSNSSGPWNSPLKIHAAGVLHYANGSLQNRGSSGEYWSSTQNDSDLAWYFINSGFLNYSGKTKGTPLRCLRE